MKELGFKVADIQTSYEFAWEYEIPGLNPIKAGRPFALHSAWIFMKRRLIADMMNDFVIKDLLDNVIGSMKDAIGQPKVVTVDHSKVGLLPGTTAQTTVLSAAKTNNDEHIDKEKILTALWDLLHQSNSFVGNTLEEANKIFKVLFTDKSDLTFVDEESLKQLNSILKPIPSKKVKNMIALLK